MYLGMISVVGTHKHMLNGGDSFFLEQVGFLGRMKRPLVGLKLINKFNHALRDINYLLEGTI